MDWKDTLIAEQTERERKYAEGLRKLEAEYLKNRTIRLNDFFSKIGIEQRAESDEVEIDGVTFRIAEQAYKYYIRASKEKCPNCHAQLWSNPLETRDDVGYFLTRGQNEYHTCGDDEQTDREI